MPQPFSTRLAITLIGMALLPFQSAMGGLKVVPLPVLGLTKKIAKVPAGSGAGKTKAKAPKKKTGNQNTTPGTITITDPNGKTQVIPIPPGSTVTFKPPTTGAQPRKARNVQAASAAAQLPYDTAANSIAEDDFNGDDVLDIAVAASALNSIKVFILQADGSVGAPVSYPVGKSPLSIITADFNLDGHPDLAVANRGDNTISILLGNPDGTFQPAKAYPAGTTPWSLASADFNGDGIPDLVVADCGDPSCTGELDTGTIFAAVGKSGRRICGARHHCAGWRPNYRDRGGPEWRRQNGRGLWESEGRVALGSAFQR